jgi:uncharacterized phage protein gp47/JayE
MIAHVRANTTLTDFNIGSVIRTILEAAALEDDEQYFQMVQLLDAFSYQTASGTELDERAADFNLTRLEAGAAVGFVKFRNDALDTDFLQFNASTGDVSLILTSSDDFPTSGFPYTVRVGEGTPQVEDVSITANAVATETLTCGALVNDHTIGERVSLVTGVSDQDISSGTQVQVPVSGARLPIVYQTGELATIIGGNYESGLTAVTATEEGSIGNVGASSIVQFTGSPPFAGAGVTNPSTTGGGRDREIDPEFRERLRDRLNQLSRGTPLAVESSVKGLEDPDTGQRIVSSQLLEDFEDNEHSLYIDDGTGFQPTRVIMAGSTLPAPVGSGLGTLTVANSSDFPVSGWVLVSPDNPVAAELIEYSSKNDAANTLSLVGLTTLAHAASDEVILVDVLPLAEEGQNYFQLSNYPIQQNTAEIYHDGSGNYNKYVDGTDYFLNRTNGQLKFFDAGLPVGTQVLAHHTYYTGLVQLAQKVVNGDKDDPVNFPGYTAAGIIVHIDTPTIRQITVVLSIAAGVGFDEESIREDVKLVVENYIDGLRIGENIILARIVELAMSIRGVENTKILTPLSDIVILEEELPKSFDSSGNSLVTVI